MANLTDVGRLSRLPKLEEVTGKEIFEVAHGGANYQTPLEELIKLLPKGDTGDDGKDGLNAPQAWLALPENAGKTEADYWAAMRGPQGEDGIQGEQGLSAPQAWLTLPENAGKTEADYWLAMRGDKGDDGERGKEGLSSLEVWLAKPENTGKTEDDYWLSLKGEKGLTGDPGRDGKNALPLNIIGKLDTIEQLPDPADRDQGDTYVIDNHWWVHTGETWEDLGSVEGPEGKSSFEVWKLYTGNADATLDDYFEAMRGRDGTGLVVRGALESTDLLPENPQTGDTYIIGEKMYVWATDVWAPVGQVGPEGKSVFDTWKLVNGKPDATEAEFLEAMRIKGDQGDQGPIGPQGPGIKILGILAEADELPAEGAPLGEGYLIGSHYWVWYDNDWHDAGSIQGPKGDDGPKGADGKNGKDGTNGKDGDPGAKGEPGKPFTILGTVEDVASLPTDAEDYDLYLVVRNLYQRIDGQWKDLGAFVGAKGDDGAPGKDNLALWLAKPENADKTEADFWEAMRGPKGEPGDGGSSQLPTYSVFQTPYPFVANARDLGIPAERLERFLAGVLDIRLEIPADSTVRFNDLAFGGFGVGVETDEETGEVNNHLMFAISNTSGIPLFLYHVQGAEAEAILQQAETPQLIKLADGSLNGMRGWAYVKWSEAEVANYYEPAEPISIPLDPRTASPYMGSPIGAALNERQRATQVTLSEPALVELEDTTLTFVWPTHTLFDPYINRQGVVEIASGSHSVDVSTAGVLWLNLDQLSTLNASITEVDYRKALHYSVNNPVMPSDYRAEPHQVLIAYFNADRQILKGQTYFAPEGGGTPGKDGQDGKDGLDAPQAWLAKPENTGKTEADYWTAMRGAPGKDGKNGTNGLNGEPLRILGTKDRWEDLPNRPQNWDSWLVDGEVWHYNTQSWINLGPLRGPQGADGPQGIQGDEGPQGPAGLSSLATWLAKEANAGKTEEDYWEAMRGDTGAEGPEGPQGPMGPGIKIIGIVDTPEDLPETATDIGDSYIVGTSNDPDVWVWLGTAFSNAGKIKGPRGERGPKGDPGIRGEEGPQGKTGERGLPGNRWIVLARPPEPTDGEVGDHYFDMSQQDLYQKINQSTWANMGKLGGGNVYDTVDDGKTYVRKFGVWVELVLPFDKFSAEGDYVGTKDGWKRLDRYDLAIKTITSGQTLDLTEAQCFHINLSGTFSVTVPDLTHTDRTMTLVFIVHGSSGSLSFSGRVNWGDMCFPALGTGYTVITMVWDTIGKQWLGAGGSSGADLPAA